MFMACYRTRLILEKSFKRNCEDYYGKLDRKEIILGKDLFMDLQEIGEKINLLLTRGSQPSLYDGRKIVFWYDEDAEYIDEIDSIVLGEGYKLWKVTEDNWFETKLQVEVRDRDTGYLLYAPFKRPDDRENHLADIYYYAEHFYSDKLVQLMGEMGVPADYQDEVKKYKKFWTSGNVKKFNALQIQNFSNDNIDLGIMCVLAGVRVLSLEELVKSVLLCGFEDNPVLRKMEHYKIHGAFWQMIENTYGYRDDAPSPRKFFATIVMTYTDVLANGHIPKAWKTFLSEKSNDCVVFVKNLMNNAETSDFYDEQVKMTALEMKVPQLLMDIPLENVVYLDSFAEFDENLISWIISKIEDDMLDEKIDGMTIDAIALLRMKSSYHYSEKYGNWYQMLYHGYLALKKISLYEYKPVLGEVIGDYAEKTYQIDTHYRKFYYYLDRLGLQENSEKIRDLVENIYTNKYLNDLSYKWNQTLSDDAYNTYAGRRESDFFADFVRPFMKEDGRAGRVVVIISDGMRYECARELFDELNLDPKCDARMDHMLSVLPSETTLGMASLLPNKEIKVTDQMEIVVDGVVCGSSLADREKILKKTVPRSACYRFDAVMQAKQAEIRDMFQDKDVVYIYQDQIDARGEKQPTENEVFHACAEAVGEIHTLINRLTGYISNTRFLVTADHGFIYKRDKLAESDKIAADKSEVSFVNKRYLLSMEKLNDNALISRTLRYLYALNEVYVSTPVGADIIRSPGGGQNYVHGGSTLQEMVVPVIKVKTARGKQDTGSVTVELSTFNNRITEVTFRLDFMQMEAVTDVLKPVFLLAYFVDEEGNKISFDVPIVAKEMSADPRDRLMTEKFTLKGGRYTRGRDYYLVLVPMDKASGEKQPPDTSGKEYRRYKFEIDIV